ncbi:MAG: cyclic pyranopterin monophosphate synthase MoaC [Chloroflexi bacterium]|nr:cyclic pyranopterin monophosphate synthase MoaC [Chloroflexota bacterium]
MYRIYTDGACLGNPGPGGWGAVVIGEDGVRQWLFEHEEETTNNRMEIMAAIKGLAAVPQGSEVTLFSDSQYLVNTMTRGWKRRMNQDLWARLDTEASKRRVHWEWVQGHAGDPGNEEADRLANQAAHAALALTHVDEKGQARMVDVGAKPDTEREAVAKGSILMRPETLELIRRGQAEKGDVLGAARIAAINAAKHTWELVPLCHQIPLTSVSVDLEPDEEKNAVHITATARATSKTGVEMEALTAVAVAALTIYDMCKAVDRGMRIQDVRLAQKRGGKSGEIVLEK